MFERIPLDPLLAQVMAGDIDRISGEQLILFD